ncbi:MAG: PH domain-containing protein [Anaerolineae bacterium]|nr:PH domain-containing protein [Anaerolineae bacterium]
MASKLPLELQKEEKLVSLVKTHPIYFVLKMIGTVLGTAIPIALFQLLSPNTGDDFLSTVFRIATIAWLIGGFVIAYFIWYRYTHDLWIVTDQRVIDSTKNHWFHHRMASTDLINIEEMKIERNGIIPTLFGFGDLICQTAGGTDAKFIFDGVPQPNKVLELVDDLRDKARQKLGMNYMRKGEG